MYSVCLPITLSFRFGWQTETEPITIFYFFYFFPPTNRAFFPTNRDFFPHEPRFFPTNRDFFPTNRDFFLTNRDFSPRTDFFFPTKFLEVFGLWRVCFPPCLVRPGRRLPVQGLSEGSLGCRDRFWSLEGVVGLWSLVNSKACVCVLLCFIRTDVPVDALSLSLSTVGKSPE